MQEDDQAPVPEHDRIHWPESMDAQHFLEHYWQKKPLLIRQAFPEFNTPLSADELAGLSLEPEISARLITCDQHDQYHSESGPFDENRFADLTGNRWSLLVTDVEKWLPQLQSWLTPFDFLPHWRIDDLMVSYAPDGASVGAHVDEYDVFLLQASGTRTWSIDRKLTQQHAPVQSGDLKILLEFSPTDTWDLQAGDLLYLPPGIAHHGVAKGDQCTTWSVGFRAPRHADLITAVADRVAAHDTRSRYSDGALKVASNGQITSEAIAGFRKIWDAAVDIDSDEFSRFMGQWLTETEIPSEQNKSHSALHHESVLARSAFSRLSWIQTNEARSGRANSQHGSVSIEDSVLLFADGMTFECSQEFAIRLCSSATRPIAYADLAPAEKNLIKQLIDAGSVHDLHSDR
jgi:50S ribosomal protein L16 3-hydroxylase